MRTNRYLFLLLMLGFLGCDSSSSIEDPNESFFVKFYGDDGDQTGNDLVAMPDGTFILFGTSRLSPDPNDPKRRTDSQWYLVKTDAKGYTLWTKTFGSLFDEEASDIELTNDGRLVAVGNTYRSPSDRDILIMTLTLDGIKIDSTVVGNLHILPTDEAAASVTQTNDGFIIAGSSSDTDIKPNAVAGDQRDALHYRVNNNLTPYLSSWGNATGPGTYDASVKVIQVSTSQYYVFGYSNKVAPGHLNPDYNYWVIGLGSTGVPNFNDLFIGLNDDEKLGSIILAPSPNDGYYLGGITNNSAGTSDIYVSKVRTPMSFQSTDIQFQKPLSIQIGSNVPEKTSVFPSMPGGFLLLANENAVNGNQNWILTKINIDGSILWTLPIVFGGEGLDTCGSVQELPDGHLVIIGTMQTIKPDAGETKMTLIKVNGEGKLLN